MNSYRWFVLSFSELGSDLCDIISEIDHDGEQWAICSQVSSEKFSGIYFKKLTLSLGRADSSGVMSDLAVETTVSLEFTIRAQDGDFLLRVSDNKRLAGSFISWLSRRAGYGFSSRPATLVNLVGRELERFSSVDIFRMIALKVSGVTVAHNIVGRMEFVSKYGMKVDEIRALPGDGFTVSTVRYELAKSNVTGILAVHSTGRVSVSGALAPWIVDYVEKNLLIR